MLPRNGYPPGVPCWVDLLQPDVDGTVAFYGALFDWTTEVRTPDGAPQRYLYARRDGLIVAGLGGPPLNDAESAGWTSFVWVSSADETAAAVEANGGSVLAPPVDIPQAGRVAMCADPEGAVFGVWQAAANRGVELVNADGSWNFSELRTADPGRAERDPEIRERQAAEQSPGGFEDAVALLSPAPGGGTARWAITFAVADADAAFARALDLGASEVVPLFDTAYTRMGIVRDPQGAELTLSEYRPPQPA